MKSVIPKLAALLPFLLLGCAAPPIDPATEANALIAAGAGNAIHFETQAHPVDEPGAAPEELNLPAAIRLSLAAEPRVQMALAKVRIAQAQADQARLLPNPILTVSMRIPDGGGKPILDAGLAADLLKILQLPRQASAADNSLRAASADAISMVLDVLADVQKQFITIQAAGELTAVLNERLKTINRLHELSLARLKAGEGTKLDIATLETEQVALEAEIIDQQQEEREARLMLARLIGQPSSAAAWRIAKWQPPQKLAASETDWIKAALQHRPELLAKHWELAALGDDLALTHFAFLEGSDVGTMAERDGPWSVGPSATVPLPLFDWGQARTAKAQASLIEARHAMLSARRQVIQEIRTAHASFHSSQTNLLKLRDRLIPLQEHRHELAEAAYRAGQTDITAFFLAEQDLREARAKLITQTKKAGLAYIQLQRATGGPGPAAVVESTTPTTRPAP